MIHGFYPVEPYSSWSRLDRDRRLTRRVRSLANGAVEQVVPNSVSGGGSDGSPRPAGSPRIIHEIPLCWMNEDDA